MYIAFVSGRNGCEVRTVHPRVYHRPAIMPLAKEFAVIRRLPSIARAVLVCLAYRARDWPLVAKLDAQVCFISKLSLAVNLIVDSWLPIRSMQRY